MASHHAFLSVGIHDYTDGQDTSPLDIEDACSSEQKFIEIGILRGLKLLRC
jgi:hypothetical protein